MSGLRIGSLCSGYEGLGTAVQAVIGGELTWVADNDPGAAAILAHRFPTVPNLGDITAVDWAAAEPVDVLCAGFPCQDISCAGKRAGLREGNRSGLWFHVARAIAELRPSLVVIENVKELLSEYADSDMEPCAWCLGDTGNERAMRALGAVLSDLAALGFDAEWTSVPAAAVGCCHLRWRVFVLAWPASDAASNEPGRNGAVALVDRGEAGDGSGSGDRGTSQDTNSATGGEWRQPAPGQAPGGRPWPDAGGSSGAPVAADAERDGQPGRPAGTAGEADKRREGSWAAVAGCGTDAPADAESERYRDAGTASERGVPAAAVAGADATPAGGCGDTRGGITPSHSLGAGLPVGEVEPDRDECQAAERSGRDGAGTFVNWREYEPAIRRHESIFGRPAPSPVEPGRTGWRLSPRFVEWMMGLPAGWVTEVPGLSRNAQLKALGNGVVPAQAAAALRDLLTRLPSGEREAA